MKRLLSLLRMHWDGEPTPNPSREGNRKEAGERLLPSWEGSGVGRFMDTARRCGFLGLALIFASLLIAVAGMMAADSAARQIPPPGIPIADGPRQELAVEAAALAQEIEALRAVLKEKPVMTGLLPDVQIFHKAVDWAARYDELYRSNDVDIARALLSQG